MASKYIFDNLSNKRIQYYILAGYAVHKDFCEMYGLEPLDYLDFIDKLNPSRDDIIHFYEFLDKNGVNPFKK